MLDLISIGESIARRRKTLKLSQAELSRKAGVSRATLDALENGRAGELGFSKVDQTAGRAWAGTDAPDGTLAAPHPRRVDARGSR